MKTLILLLLSIPTFAQIKIGELNLDLNTAKVYFVDCIMHPDTVMLRDSDECYATVFAYKGQKSEVKKFHHKPKPLTHKDSIQRGLIKLKPSEGWTLPVQGTIILGDALSGGNVRYYQTDEECEKRIRAANTLIRSSAIAQIEDAWGWEWYIVPRKHTEADFSKWLLRHVSVR